MNSVYEDNVEAMADEFSKFVNRNSATSALDGLGREMAHDHPTLQQLKMRVALSFIAEMAKKPYSDARNDASVAIAKKIIIGIGDEHFFHGSPILPYI